MMAEGDTRVCVVDSACRLMLRLSLDGKCARRVKNLGMISCSNQIRLTGNRTRSYGTNLENIENVDPNVHFTSATTNASTHGGAC